MSDLRVVHRRGMDGWWILEGQGWPPQAQVIATFGAGQLDRAVKYVQMFGEKKGGRPSSGLNDEIVWYALRAAGKGKKAKPRTDEHTQDCLASGTFLVSGPGPCCLPKGYSFATAKNRRPDRAAQHWNVRRASQILGVHYNTVRQFLAAKSDKKAG